MELIPKLSGLLTVSREAFVML